MARWQSWSIAGLALLGALVWLNNYVLPSADSVPYMVLGRALASGQGYRMISAPAAPLMRLYPPGYPALLALPIGLGGYAGEEQRLAAATLAAKLVNPLFFVGSALLFQRLAARWLSSWAAWLAGLLFVFNPTLLYFATQIGAELPFTFFCLAALYLAERWERGAAWALWVLPLCIAGAFYMRTVGVALWAALVLWLLVRRRWRAALVVGGLALALIVPWFIYVAGGGAGTPLEKDYLTQLFAADPYGEARVSLAGMEQRIWHNVTSYAGDIVPAALLPHLGSVRQLLGTGMGWGVVALLLAGVLAGYALSWRAGGSAAEAFVPLFALTFAFWPWVLGMRLVMPVLPLLLLYLTLASARLAGAVAQRLGRAGWASALLALLLLPLLLSAWRVDLGQAGDNLRAGILRPPAAYFQDQPQWRRYFEVLGWLDAHVERDAVCMGRNAAMIYFLIGRRAVEYPYVAEPTALAETIQAYGVQYIVEDQFTWTNSTSLYLRPAMDGLPGHFALRYATEAPATKVWAVLR